MAIMILKYMLILVFLIPMMIPYVTSFTGGSGFMLSSLRRRASSNPSFFAKMSTALRNTEYPSDSHDPDDDFIGAMRKVESEEDAALREALNRELLLMSSVTSRGEYVSNEEERELIMDIVLQLEALNPTVDPALNCDGQWDLCMVGSLKGRDSSEDGKKKKNASQSALLRVSPFFLTLRSILGESNKALLQILEDKVFGNGRALTFGRLRQVVSSNSREFRSEVSLEGGMGMLSLLPLPLLRIKIVTTAELTAIPPNNWNLVVMDASIENENVGELPELFSTLSNPATIPLSDFISKVNKGKVPSSTLRTFYVDEGLRISRDEDENFFVFARE
eukprot:CAMPEP_0116055432 /NCGR_PEP_ID=MMETSP0322-20121206/3407_1 /TAXON_ID=163516 /ORGANISM="Leptocylindrus danicus var. apora, Strain B651" /LENGTH=333 /DNA_ID=CAMNT_0003539041 /DNA_START=232 /DNA_END=1233 /DNA_ORIENTATION=+